MAKFALIVCTYMRPKALLKLLQSVKGQSLYPNTIIIIDASPDDKTELVIKKHQFKSIDYHLVNEDHRGLTRQRNFGIKHLPKHIEIVCFLDDDIVLDKNYFNELINTYSIKPEAIAVGGYITNEVVWKPHDVRECPSKSFCMDGWQRQEPAKFELRRRFGLLPDTSPGIICSFSHGRSTSFLPPSGKIYEVEQFMGGASSYRAEVFKHLSFSRYFVGYGLYEDVDFCIRLLPFGKLYVNTSAKLNHYHEPSGRPNQFNYGKMVVRNGWYVWRLKNPHPRFKTKIKWYGTTILLTILRFLNTFNTSENMEAFSDAMGRVYGLLSILIKKPQSSYNNS